MDCGFLLRYIERIHRFRKHCGLWISCAFWRGLQIVLVLMLGSWVLSEIWIKDLSSASVGMLMSSSKLFLFSHKAHLNLVVRLLLELYCVIVIKHVALFTTCVKSLVTMALAFTFLDVIVFWDLKKNIGGLKDLAKKGTDGWICKPLFTSLF